MIRILLVDDQAIIREAMRVLLEKEQDFEVVGTADNGQTAIEQVAATRPDLLLCDIEMPVMNGIAATRVISQRFPDTKVIVLTSHGDEVTLASALQAGANGYLLKDTVTEDLVSTVRLVHRGHSQLGPGLFEKIVANVSGSRTAASLKPIDIPGLGITESELRLQLEHFDIDVLLKLVEDAIKNRAIAPFLLWLQGHLEDNPANLAALYLSGSLLRRDQAQSNSALLHLRFGFREGIQQKLPRPGLLLFYQEGLRLQSEAAFSWLTQPGSPWNHEDELPFLLNEAAQQFGNSSPFYLELLALQQIRAMSRLSKACVGLNSRLAVLQRGFRRLDTALLR
jgi:DNA-binding NarL/FixJ family response regulator